MVGDDQHRLEAAQQPVGAPVARQLDGGAFEVAAILFELRLESGEQREGVGGRAGKSGEDRVVVQPADLARAVLEDRVAQGDLAVAGEHGAVLVPHSQDRRRVNHSASISTEAGPRVQAPRGGGQSNRTLGPANFKESRGSELAAVLLIHRA